MRLGRGFNSNNRKQGIVIPVGDPASLKNQGHWIPYGDDDESIEAFFEDKREFTNAA
jgi:hypothetical protein